MTHSIRHGAGFLVSGGMAFVTDASILALLTRGFGFNPYSARVFAIGCAIVVGFFAHRRLTFDVKEAATLKQFAKFVGVATTSALVNYAIYALVLLSRPGIEPLVALVIATSISMCVSYTGLRFGVFRKPKP